MNDNFDYVAFVNKNRVGQYIVNEAVNPEMDKKVKRFLVAIAKDLAITEEEAAHAVVTSIKRIGHKF